MLTQPNPPPPFTRCSDEGNVGDTTQIQLRDMEGLFLFCGVISAIAIVVAAFRRLRRRMPTGRTIASDCLA
jgi:hypothetical protein